MRPSPAPVLDLAETTKVTPCCSKVGLKRGPWTVEEDEVLSSFIRREGEGKWRTLPKRAGLQRCGKSCRLRWMNYLRPSVKRGKIAPDEEDLILRLHRLLGNRWSLIAGRLPGRTDNEIKNYWNTHLRKKLIRQGIDPRTHKPLNTELLCSSLELDSQAVASPVPTSTSLSPNPNPNPNVQFKNATSSLGNQSNDISLDLLDPFNNRHYFGGSTFDLAGDWPAFDNIEAIAGASPNSHAVGEAVENKDVNCSTDDLFSSFLNSIINDEVPEQDTANSDGIWNNAQATLPLENQVLSFENQVFWEPASFAYSEIFNEGEHNVNPSTNDMGQKH